MKFKKYSSTYLNVSWFVPPTCLSPTLLNCRVDDLSLGSVDLSSGSHPCWYFGASGPFAQGLPPRSCTNSKKYSVDAKIHTYGMFNLVLYNQSICSVLQHDQSHYLLEVLDLRYLYTDVLWHHNTIQAQNILQYRDHKCGYGTTNHTVIIHT